MGLRSGQVAQRPLDTFRSESDCRLSDDMVAIHRRQRGHSCLVSRCLREAEGARVQRADYGRAESRCRRTGKAALRDVCDSGLAVAPLDIVIEDLEEIGDNRVALQCHEQLAVYVHRRFGLFEGPR